LPEADKRGPVGENSRDPPDERDEMRMNPVLTCGAFLLMAAASLSSLALADTPVPKKLFANADMGIAFLYPGHFEIWRHKRHEQVALRDGTTRIALLVEPKQRVSRARALREGEAPYIELFDVNGAEAKRWVDAMNRGFGADYRQAFGTTLAYKHPFELGPLGDRVSTYLVPVDDDRVIKIVAHKYYFNDPSHTADAPVATHYDTVVDAMLSTLTASHRARDQVSGASSRPAM
jgi:hypothetical protein